MRDIAKPRVLWLKAALLLAAGLFAALLLLAEHPDLKTTFLLAVCVWAFARCYYFAFYVISHYVDERFRFSGLSSVARYLLRRRARRADGD